MVWTSSYEELELVAAAMQKRSGRPYARTMNEAEKEEKAQVRAQMEEWGVIPRGHRK